VLEKTSSRTQKNKKSICSLVLPVHIDTSKRCVNEHPHPSFESRCLILAINRNEPLWTPIVNSRTAAEMIATEVTTSLSPSILDQYSDLSQSRDRQIWELSPHEVFALSTEGCESCEDVADIGTMVVRRGCKGMAICLEWVERFASNLMRWNDDIVWMVHD